MEFNGRVYVGNETDSRCGGKVYAYWTITRDYRFVVDGEDDVFLHYRNYDHDVVTVITPVEGVEGCEVSFYKINETVRRKYFRFRFPDGNEEAENIFVLGELEGSLKNEEIKWVDSHLIYNRAVTRELRDRFGDFEAVAAPQYRSAKGNVCFVLNDVYIINVWPIYIAQPCCGGSHFGWRFEVESLEEKRAAQKAFGLRASRLRQICGVPWNIAKMAADIADEESAISALKKVRAARGLSWGAELEHELGCGISRRKSAISYLIGDEAYEALGVEEFGQGKSLALADYLLGK